jgi:hypothetical protein
MLRFSAALIALFCLLGCNSKSVHSTAESRGPLAPGTPKSTTPGDAQFQGTVGQLEDGASFIEFMTKHEGQTITLDAQFPAASFDGGRDGPAAFFVVLDDCDDPDQGQQRNKSVCTGFQYTVPDLPDGTSPLVQETGGAWRLRGQFTVVNGGGPHQGLMAVQLRPVISQSVRAK